jgi:hypothetical protein
MLSTKAKDSKLNIGYIGNFLPEFSTENERKWAFEKLGHTVHPLQENRINRNDLLEIMPMLDMLIYSHTHDPSFVINGLIDVFNEYKKNNIPTVSAHLDRWLWLKRELDMGNEATWFTEYIFMADASPEAVKKYNDLNLNWHYLKPAVAEPYCYMALPNREKYPHDIVFTGSKRLSPRTSIQAKDD